MWVVPLPLSVAISKNKKFILNLNQYRNTHYQTLNKAKVAYHTLVQALLKEYGVPKLHRVKLVFTLYPQTHALVDTSNVCCIVEKFFNDGLVETGLLDDDNFKFLPESLYRYGFVDKRNPRVDVQIIPITGNPYGKCMKIILTKDDLVDALRNHIDNGGVISIAEGVDVDFEFLDNGDVEVLVGADAGSDNTDTLTNPPTARKTAAKRTRRTKAQIEADEAAAKAEAQATQAAETDKADDTPPFEPEVPVQGSATSTKTEVPDLSGPGALFDDEADDSKPVEIPQDPVSEIGNEPAAGASALPPAEDLFKDV